MQKDRAINKCWGFKATLYTLLRKSASRLVCLNLIVHFLGSISLFICILKKIGSTETNVFRVSIQFFFFFKFMVFSGWRRFAEHEIFLGFETNLDFLNQKSRCRLKGRMSTCKVGLKVQNSLNAPSNKDTLSEITSTNCVLQNAL